METETVKVSDVKKLIATAHATLCVVLHALDTKILVGEINRPDVPTEKKPRKKRTCKVKTIEFPPPTTLPDADKDNTFYGKKKRERKEVIE